MQRERYPRCLRPESWGGPRALGDFLFPHKTELRPWSPHYIYPWAQHSANICFLHTHWVQGGQQPCGDSPQHTVAKAPPKSKVIVQPMVVLLCQPCANIHGPVGKPNLIFYGGKNGQPERNLHLCQQHQCIWLSAWGRCWESLLQPTLPYPKGASLSLCSTSGRFSAKSSALSFHTFETFPNVLCHLQ